MKAKAVEPRMMRLSPERVAELDAMSRKPKHTPGSWEVFGCGQIVASNGTEVVAETPQAFIENRLADPSITDEQVRQWLAEWQSRCKANAKLIAAAPDLAEACKRVLTAIQWSVQSERMTPAEQAATLHAALVKAGL